MVLADNELNPIQQCALVIGNTDSTLGCFSKCVASRLSKVIITPYSALVSLPRECCVQLWAPWCKTGMDMLE